MPERVVIVGGSIAGLRAAESLRQGGHDGPLTIIGAESHKPYDRPPLSKQILTGKAQPGDITLHMQDTLDVEWVLGDRVSALDTTAKTLRLASGETVGFDQLVVATGASPRRLAIAPSGPGVHYLRTVEDAVGLRDDLRHAESLAVIGAGFIGLEVASSALSMDTRVTVLEALPVPLERAIGAQLGHLVADWHRSKGVDVRLAAKFAGIQVSSSGASAGRPEGVRLEDGTVIEADTVLVCIGVAPETDWLEGSGVDVDNGVLCDERLRIKAGGRVLPWAVAIGDVARWEHPGYGTAVRVEHWTNATETAESAAQTLLEGDEADPFDPVPYVWTDQHGVKMQFVGRADPDDEIQWVEGSFDDERFLVTYGRDGRLVAALGMRRPARVMAMQREIHAGAEFPVPEV